MFPYKFDLVHQTIDDHEVVDPSELSTLKSSTREPFPFLLQVPLLRRGVCVHLDSKLRVLDLTQQDQGMNMSPFS